MKLALHCQGRQQLNKRILPCLGRRQGYFSSRKIISSSSNTSHWLAKDNSRVAAKRNYHSSPPSEPGSLAFAAGELAAVSDLFFRYANTSDGGIDQDGSSFLTPSGVRKMLSSIGENPDDATFEKLFHAADLNGDGKLQLHVRMICKVEEELPILMSYYSAFFFRKPFLSSCILFRNFFWQPIKFWATIRPTLY